MSSAGKPPGGHTPGKQKGRSVSTARDMAVRLKTANKRTTSQQKWLQRQLNDPYVARAKAEGWRSRAAYKLIEIDDKYHMLKPGQRIVDLGCAPGGWCQVAALRTRSTEADPRVVGIDLLPVDPIPGVTLLEMDFMLPEADEKLRETLGGKGSNALADGVISDMAANTTGHKATDHLKIVGLAEGALAFALEVLAPGGFFLCKLFQGGETVGLINQLKQNFATVRHVKPQSSRSGSSELYVLAMGFKK